MVHAIMFFGGIICLLFTQVWVMAIDCFQDDLIASHFTPISRGEKLKLFLKLLIAVIGLLLFTFLGLLLLCKFVVAY
jgi:hypothetical protein